MGLLVQNTGVDNNGNLNTSGTITVNDVDTGESSFQSVSNQAGTYGDFSITTSGIWTYTVNNRVAAIQNLISGHNLTDSFTFHSFDGTAEVVTVTILGSASPPIFTPTSQNETAAVNDDITVERLQRNISVFLFDCQPQVIPEIPIVLQNLHSLLHHKLWETTQ